MKLTPNQKLLCIKTLWYSILKDKSYITKGKYYTYLRPHYDDGSIITTRDGEEYGNEVVIYALEVPIHFQVNPTISPNIRIL